MYLVAAWILCDGHNDGDDIGYCIIMQHKCCVMDITLDDVGWCTELDNSDDSVGADFQL